MIQDMCSDNKKNLYIQRNTQLLRMAQEDHFLVRKLLMKLWPKNMSDGIGDMDASFDQIMNEQEILTSGGGIFQRYTQVDAH